MSQGALAANASLKLGPAADNLTELNYPGSGLTGVVFGRARQTRIPAAGAYQTTKALDLRSGSLTFQIADTATTRPLLLGANMTAMHIEHSPDGTATGDAKHTAKVIVQAGLQAPPGQTMIWQVTIVTDGAITTSSH